MPDDTKEVKVGVLVDDIESIFNASREGDITLKTSIQKIPLSG